MMNKEEHDIRIKKLKPLLREVLSVLGENPNRDGLLKTPERWGEALLSSTVGNFQDPQEMLKVSFDIKEEATFNLHNDMVLIDNIEFVSTCEHHIAPIRGIAHIAYIPNIESKKVVGLSKIPRVVNAFARRLQIQERMTQEIADVIDQCLNPLGVMVMIHAIHYCMIQRGVEQHASTTLTTARRGLFLTDPVLETKFQGYLSMHKKDNSWQM